MNKTVSIIFGILVTLAFVGGVWLLTNARDTAVERGPLGFDGLVVVLADAGLETVVPHRAITITPDEIALRILPLWDTDTLDYSRAPDNRAEELAQQDLRDIPQYRLRGKVAAASTMVVLPKWRGAVPILETADRSLLVDFKRINGMLNNLDARDEFTLSVVRPSAKFETYRDAVTGSEITLYEPQVFDADRLPSDCQIVMDTRAGPLMVSCNVVFYKDDDPYQVVLLSDPDFLNNHGLGVADNSLAAPNILRDRFAQADQRFVVDQVDFLFVDDGQEDPEPTPRTLGDFARYFDYPFSVIWLSLMAMMAVAMWRGWWRFGPPVRVFDDEIVASKTVSIAAKARLLQLAGQDDILAREFGATRMHSLFSLALGPHAAHDMALLRNRLMRYQPEIAKDFFTAFDDLNATSNETPAGELARRVSRFDDQYQRVCDAIGRVSRGR